MEQLFKLKAHNTNVKTEVMAGITTFMTMAYILAVNPGILSAAGMPAGGVFTATALASLIATVVMALIANLPIALLPAWASTRSSRSPSCSAWAIPGNWP